MATYMINYDLVKPGRNYDELIEAIKTYPRWCHPLESCWIIESSREATAIRDHLTKHMDDNDKILVIKVSVPAAWRHLPDAVSKWIQNNLK